MQEQIIPNQTNTVLLLLLADQEAHSLSSSFRVIAGGEKLDSEARRCAGAALSLQLFPPTQI